MENHNNNLRNDHDAIVTLVAEVKNVRVDLSELRSDVKDLKNNTVARVDALEREKLEKAEAYRLKQEADIVHGDHEKRIRLLEKWGWKIVGAAAVISFVASYLINKYS